MPRKATWALIVWLALGVVGYLILVPSDPDCVADPSAELCDRLAAVATGFQFLGMAFVWLVVMVALAIAWVASRRQTRHSSARSPE
ncbi:MAG: hypothetical protein U0667_08315 [Chloroflexota bacterium]